jgi:hypothetical protein
VLGRCVDAMLADAFEARALDTGGPAWTSWLDVLAARNQLAPRIELADVARAWSRRTSAERVTVVLDPARVGRLVGVRRGLTVPETLSADAVDLARRVAAVLGLLVGPERRAALLARTLAPRLRGRPGPRLSIPEQHRAWVDERADRMRRRLQRAGYPVVASAGTTGRRSAAPLDALLPTYPQGVQHVADSGVLQVALDLLLETPAAPTRRQEGTA